MPEGHDILAPSAAHRWVHCAGSVPLEAQVASSELGADELEGNAAHHIAGELLMQAKRAAGFPASVPRWKPAANDVTPNGVIVTDEMLKSVDLFVGEILERIGDAT